jgi:hypothetical protein
MRKTIITIALILFGFSLAAPALAGIPSIVPADCTGQAMLSDCNLDDVEMAIGNIAQIILGITGSLALLMFMIGGIMYITSAGKKDQIQKATKTLRFAVIGLAIVMFSGVAIKLLLKVLTGVK